MLPTKMWPKEAASELGEVEHGERIAMCRGKVPRKLESVGKQFWQTLTLTYRRLCSEEREKYQKLGEMATRTAKLGIPAFPPTAIKARHQHARDASRKSSADGDEEDRADLLLDIPSLQLAGTLVRESRPQLMLGVLALLSLHLSHLAVPCLKPWSSTCPLQQGHKVVVAQKLAPCPSLCFPLPSVFLSVTVARL